MIYCSLEIDKCNMKRMFLMKTGTHTYCTLLEIYTSFKYLNKIEKVFSFYYKVIIYFRIQNHGLTYRNKIIKL